MQTRSNRRIIHSNINNDNQFLVDFSEMAASFVLWVIDFLNIQNWPRKVEVTALNLRN